jgi:hypothetical protein
MTTENTVNTAETTAAVAPAAPSKMTLCKGIFASVQGTETPRKSFIAQAQLAIEDGGAGMTKSGASTYYQNLKRQSEGGKLYQTAAKKPEERAAETAEAATISEESVAAEDAAEAEATAAE